MNPAADPLFVAAEVEYRYERDHVGTGPTDEHHDTGRLRAALSRLVHPTRRHGHAPRTRHA